MAMWEDDPIENMMNLMRIEKRMLDRENSDDFPKYKGGVLETKGHNFLSSEVRVPKNSIVLFNNCRFVNCRFSFNSD